MDEKKLPVTSLILTIIAFVIAIFLAITDIEIVKLMNIGDLQALGLIVLLPLAIAFIIAIVILSLISLINLFKNKKGYLKTPLVILIILDILFFIECIVTLLIFYL